jgi:DNA integrity scanning protein DisA with diadenylate cyclase activity
VAIPHERPDTHVIELPNVPIASTDRVSLGLLLATADGLVDHHADVVCLTGLDTAQLDCVMVAKPTVRFGDILSDKLQARSGIQPAVMLRVISLAIEIAAEGREGQPCGTMFVLGDTAAVQSRARQLVLNPFHGFSPEIRNVLDPSLTETVKEFALIDGAFVVESDGTLASAGTYILPTRQEQVLPGGLGTRHQAAAAITADTHAIAVVVSQSTGKVTVFQGGRLVLSLNRPSVTRW